MSTAEDEAKKKILEAVRGRTQSQALLLSFGNPTTAFQLG